MKMNSREKKRNTIKDKQEKKTIKITGWIKQTATQQEEQQEKYLINFTVIRNLYKKMFPITDWLIFTRGYRYSIYYKSSIYVTYIKQIYVIFS